jgi:hypothetical protein
MTDPLSRRERQIMDLAYQLGEVAVSDVHERMADPPSYSAVRALMGTLVEKGHLSHRQAGAVEDLAVDALGPELVHHHAHAQARGRRFPQPSQ